MPTHCGSSEARSLNLSNAVAITVFEALRQLSFYISNFCFLRTSYLIICSMCPIIVS